MKFMYQFYNFQKEILDIFQEQIEKNDKKIHLVSPPGSGKTILGIEILRRLGGVSIILVPNLTLKEQWKDKIQSLFLENHEKIDDIVSCDKNIIKTINIHTYQSISGTENSQEASDDKILTLWFENEKDDFHNYEEFLDFISVLKDQSEDEYIKLYKKYIRKNKNNSHSDEIPNILHENIQDYFAALKNAGLKNILVDESHHLTSWWSKVIFSLHNSIENAYIIGLTATPPFDDIDYFKLDQNYKNLLGEVDYYIPTPAVVKSGKLAPYSDMVYFVQPEKNLDEILKRNYIALENFIENYGTEIARTLYAYVNKNIESLQKNQSVNLRHWINFLLSYLPENEEIIFEYNSDEIESPSIETLAKSCGKVCHLWYRLVQKQEIIEQAKNIFYKVGYIWRSNNFYKFETPVEKALIYSETKLDGLGQILSREIQSLENELKGAIITDFFEHEEYGIHCKKILKYVSTHFPQKNPYLVSGQGIWTYESGEFREHNNETILSATQKLQKGDIHIIIGTRGMLGEGWDCPEINTLVDLTGVSSYMSVNQIHGRGIRLDTNNSEKVCNIYNIVCLGSGLNAKYDFDRLKRKQNQFYGVDDSGNIIKGVDHLYPQIEEKIIREEIEEINSYMLQKILLRSMVYTLWNVGKPYKNQESFSLSLQILTPFHFYPIPLNFWHKLFSYRPSESKKSNLFLLGQSKYHKYIRIWIENFIETISHLLRYQNIFSSTIKFTIDYTPQGNISIHYNGTDMLEGKKFIQILYEIFTSKKHASYTYSETYKNHNNLRIFLPNLISGNKLKRAILTHNNKNLSKSDRKKYKHLRNETHFLKGKILRYNSKNSKIQNHFSAKIEKIWL